MAPTLLDRVEHYVLSLLEEDSDMGAPPLTIHIIISMAPIGNYNFRTFDA